MNTSTTLMASLLLCASGGYLAPRSLKSKPRNIYLPAGRTAYSVVLIVDGKDTEDAHILRERYMTRAEVEEVLTAIERCPRITDYRIRQYSGPAQFEKGQGDLLRIIHQLKH